MSDGHVNREREREYRRESKRISTLSALWACRDDFDAAARMLGVDRATVFRRVRRWQLLPLEYMVAQMRAED
jgi:transcriptional regulator of acetoin/glycerol metabolism